MNRSYVILRSSLIYFSGSLVSKLLVFVLLPLYTRYLSNEDFGRVDLAMAALPLIAPLFTVQVTETIFRFLYTAKTLADQKRTVTVSFLIFICGMIVYAIVYKVITLRMEAYSSGLLFWYFPVAYLSVFFQQILRGLQRSGEYAAMNVVSTIVQANVSIVLITKLGVGAESLLIAAMCSSLVVVTISAVRTKFWRFLDIRLVSWLEVKKQLRYGVPLVPNQICWWVTDLLGKYMLSYFHGHGNTGVLAVASKFSGLLTGVTSIFFLAWTESIIGEFDSADRDKFFSQCFENFLLAVCGFVSCLMPIIRIYSDLTITGEFVEARLYTPILLLAALLNALAAFLGTVYTASMMTKQAFRTSAIAATSNIMLSLFLIPKLSIWGVALAKLSSYLIFVVTRIYSVGSIVNLRLPRKEIILGSIVILGISLLGYYCLGTKGQLILLVLVLPAVLFLNRKTIA